MKKIFPLLLFSITYFSLLKVNAQCSNTLPAKPWGDDRPATECELLFYRTNYPLIIKSFQKMETYIANNYIPGGYNPDPNKGMIDFDANSVVDVKYIHNFNVGIGSEKTFFHDLQDLNWSFSKKTDDEAYAKAYNEVNNFFGSNGQYSAIEYDKALLEKVGFDKMGKDEKKCKALMLSNELTNKFSFTASMQGINISEDKFENTHASFELLNIKSCAYAIRVIKNKTITDAGDAEQADMNNHIDELHLYIGKWKAPQISKVNGFVVQNNFNLSQPKLSVQNLLIIIKCCPELQEEVLKQIDLNSLQNLIQP